MIGNNTNLAVCEAESNVQAATSETEEELFRLKAIFNGLPDAIFVHDFKGKFLEINDAACQKLGYEKSELLAMSPSELYIPEHHTGISMGEIMEGLKRGPVIFEATHQSKHGENFNMEIHCRLINYNNTPAILSIGRDITSRKKEEDFLKLEGERLKGIVNNSPALIFLKDTNSRYTFVNNEFKKYFPDPTGSTDFELFNKKTATSIRNIDKQIFQKESLIVSEDKIPQNGQTHTYYTIKVPVRNIEGKITSLCGISLDISHLKETEEVLKKSKNQLKALNKTKDRLFSIIAHDLRNPFNQLLGFSELLLEDFDSYDRQEIKEIVKTIYAVSQTTNSLLGNLLQWSRIQSNGIRIQLENFEVTSAVFDVLMLYDHSCKEKNLKIINHVPAGLTLKSDKQMVLTILRNLIGNAIKYTQDWGEIKISYNQSENFHEISILDNGEGMSPDMIQKLLSPKNFLSTTGTNGEEGSGLGILLCRELIDKLEGSLIIKSEKGMGSKFTIQLPNK